MTSIHTFYADAVLFDMDGTLTDSIQAVEAAWTKVANDIEQDAAHVIASTHGKRAIDNLLEFKPHLKAHEMDDEVSNFEETILAFADAYTTHGPGSTPSSSGAVTPALTTGSSAINSAAASFSASDATKAPRPSFLRHVRTALSVPGGLQYEPTFDDSAVEDDADIVIFESDEIDKKVDEVEAWVLEAAEIDRSVRILPGVKAMIASIPAGRYAVATSGAKTYAHGCMNRVGIVPPPVTITADDKRLKAGKPAPDPFLLAAECLGYDIRRCVVFEDSPSGIKAGIASGATVIAVCTSHEREKIEGCGAHYLVEDMCAVKCEVEGDQLKFTISV